MTTTTFMRRVTRVGIAGLILALAFPTAGYAQEKQEHPQMKQEAKKDLIGVLEAQGNYSQLVAALQQTGLAEELKQEKAITLFAPTDDAFKNLPEGTLASMKKEQLKQLLRKHIVPGALPLEQAAQEGTLASLEGYELTVQREGATVNEARIVHPDLTFSNGVVHGIDTVLGAPGAQPGR